MTNPIAFLKSPLSKAELVKALERFNVRMEHMPENIDNQFCILDYVHIHQFADNGCMLYNRYDFGPSYAIVLIARVGRGLGIPEEDYGTVALNDIPRYGVNKDGLWACPMPGHEYYRFRLLEQEKVTFLNHQLTDMYLIGEGNHLHTLRRHIRYHLGRKSTFNVEDIQELSTKLTTHKVSIVVRFRSGYMFDLGLNKFIDSRMLRNPPPKIQVIFQRRDLYVHDKPITVKAYLHPTVEAVRQQFREVE